MAALKAAIEHYPFYQALYLLLLQNMYKVHDPEFSAYLKKYAVFVADRSALFDMIEGANYQIPVQKLADDTAADTGDRTLALIDNFLSTLPDAPASASASPSALTFPNDYSAYLEQLPDCLGDSTPHAEPETPHIEAAATPAQPENAPTLPKNEPILPENAPTASAETLTDSAEAPTDSAETLTDSAEAPTAEVLPTENAANKPQTENKAASSKNEAASSAAEDEFTVTAIRKHLAEQTDEELATSSAEISNNDNSAENGPDSDYFTEAMAGIYIKQQKYEQAFEIIKAISMDNPKKSVYFADQMRYLQLLIRINRNKK